MSRAPARTVTERAMMSALECQLKAAHCEDMARDCADPADRSLLLEVAAMWRNLAVMRPVTRFDLVREAP
jgi:hypothetical protein